MNDAMYKYKTGMHIDSPFFPPDHFKRGPVQVDQGISF